jgi:CubicO group peptidase (beta-lactamase class C family)
MRICYAAAALTLAATAASPAYPQDTKSVVSQAFAAVGSSETLPRGKPEDVGMSSERLATIKTTLRADVEGGKIPGAVIAVARRGQLVYFEAIGFRDKAAGVPMTTDTIFNIASMTKPITAVAALMLVEQGRLMIDDPAKKYLPQLADTKVAVLDATGDNILD